MKDTCRKVALCAIATLLCQVLPAPEIQGAIRIVVVGGSELPGYTPASITIQPGETVRWEVTGVLSHTITSGPPGMPDGLFDSGLVKPGDIFTYTFPKAGSYPYYCIPHYQMGMIGLVTVEAATPTPTPTPCPSVTPRPPSQAQLLNISTRLRVQSGDNVLIGGFIVTGTEPKQVLLRAIGPSLADAGIDGVLADPVLELHGPDGSLIMSNDNWRDTQEMEIQESGLPPTDDLESAIVATLTPNSYTAIVSGKGGASGVGLVEAYDLDQPADSQLANISTRGFVETESNVMIDGFILGNGSGNTNVLIRALGPSLTAQGVAGALADPTLELHDANGAIVEENDNWKDTEECLIEGTNLPPPDDLESAILVGLPAAAYTVIVAGKDGLTGVALVEVYRLP